MLVSATPPASKERRNDKSSPEKFAEVAQQVEHYVEGVGVSGSIPLFGTNSSRSVVAKSLHAVHDSADRGEHKIAGVAQG